MFQQCPHCQSQINLANQRPDSAQAIVCNHCQQRFTIGLTSAARKNTPLLSADDQTHLLAQTIHAPRQASSWRWFSASLLLLLIFFAQVAYFQRNSLASYLPLRPWLQTYCQWLDCQLPLLRDPAQISIVARDVRSHPQLKNALLINLTLQNNAPYAQAWPTIKLVFADISGTPVAQRHFRARDYLDPAHDPAQGFAAKSISQINLELLDPGEAAVNFAFEFL